MPHLLPPPPALVAQVMPICGSRAYGSGEVVTPHSTAFQLGCSAPIGDGSGGYVRLKPTFPSGAIRVEPDSFPPPNWP